MTLKSRGLMPSRRTRPSFEIFSPSTDEMTSLRCEGGKGGGRGGGGGGEEGRQDALREQLQRSWLAEGKCRVAGARVIRGVT